MIKKADFPWLCQTIYQSMAGRTARDTGQEIFDLILVRFRRDRGAKAQKEQAIGLDQRWRLAATLIALVDRISHWRDFFLPQRDGVAFQGNFQLLSICDLS